ncbi:hypothetical protein [Halomonas sp. E19]|uniref:hypothetical protein n=1 Tax=Halomonas sp. E19 TaxID=3397247 RepID=UPI0040346EC0
MDTASLPWDMQARYRLIEVLALWEGKVAASQVGTVFGIGRQQSQKILRKYRDLAPKNLVYDVSKKGSSRRKTSSRFSLWAGLKNTYIFREQTRNWSRHSPD